MTLHENKSNELFKKEYNALNDQQRRRVNLEVRFDPKYTHYKHKITDTSIGFYKGRNVGRELAKALKKSEDLLTKDLGTTWQKKDPWFST